MLADSAVPMALGTSEQAPVCFIYWSNTAKDASTLGLRIGAKVQERSVISNTSLPLAVPVGWAEALLHDAFRLLQC